MEKPLKDNERKTEVIQNLVKGGAEIAGSAVGAALGFLAAGPVGAAALGAGGALAAMALKQIGQEVSDRFLSQRERIRVGGVIAIAASEISKRIDKGLDLRNDGFFESCCGNRSDAEEVVESVLLKSQREPEEKKIVYMGYLIANIAFDTNISASMAHQITKAAEGLTYRQLCILKLAVVKSAFQLRQGDYRGQGSFSKELYQILYECVDLYHSGFINFGGSVAFGPTDVNPGGMTVQGLGADVFNLMSLSKIPDQDLTSIAMMLR